MFSIFQSNQRTTISKIVSQIFYRIVTNNRLSVPIGWGGHHDAWPKLREALSNDTPDYALFISWGILGERGVEFEGKPITEEDRRWKKYIHL